MILKPRDYQEYAVDQTGAFLFNTPAERCPLILMPTGTGKSVVIARLIERLLTQWYSMRVLVLTHVKELVQQNADKMLTIWPNAPMGIVSAGLGRTETKRQIIFAGIGSVVRRDLGRVDVVIIDEAHRISPANKTTYQIYLNELRKKNPHVRVIGLTATGFRMGQGSLIEEGGLFTDACVDMCSYEGFNWFLEQGYLVPPVPRPTETKIDTSGLHLRGGDFIESEITHVLQRDQITERALLETMTLAAGRKKWLIFGSGTQHCKDIHQMLNGFGVSCGIVVSGQKNRDSEIAAFKAGRYRAIVNNNILTTGFDDPEIDCIVVLRPTASSNLWVQILGRGTRPDYAFRPEETPESRWAAIMQSTKWNCLVLDFANNTRRLGPINDPVMPRKPGQKAGTAPIKTCDVCGTENHTRALWCINCYNKFSFNVKIKENASSDELVKTIEERKVEIFPVDHTTYLVHKKVGKPDQLKVVYQCGNKHFYDYVGIEHPDWAGRKAASWWRKRTGDTAVPTGGDGKPSTALALSQFQRIKNPTHLSVWVNTKWPEITDYCFDGTAFGRQMDDGTRPACMNEVAAAPLAEEPSPVLGFLAYDDPF